MSTGHCFTPPSPHYPNLVQLDGQQCYSAKVHPYAYPQHMNMLKHFTCIKYEGVEVEWVELYSLNHVNTSLFTPSSPHYPNLVQHDGQQCNSAKVHPYAYPQHMNMLKYCPCIKYEDVEVKWVELYNLNHVNRSLLHPFIPTLPKSGSTW